MTHLMTDLDTPYDPEWQPPVDTWLKRRLNAYIPEIDALAEAIVADFDEDSGGVRWWKDCLGEDARILISDYLYSLFEALSRSVLDAAVDLLELKAIWEPESRRRNGYVLTACESGATTLQLPRPVSPAEELPKARADIHLTDFFRAIGTGLDTLAGIVVGVTALPISIVKCDIEKVKRALRANKRTSFQQRFLDEFESAIQQAGPQGWLGYAVRYRNAMIHRARPLKFAICVGEPSTLLDARGRPIPSIKSSWVLPRAPELTDAQAWRGSVGSWTLCEPAELTLAGLLESFRSLLKAALPALLVVWQERRAAPAPHPQPQQQWPDLSEPPASGFAGYAPELRWGLSEGQQVVSSPSLLTRMRAARVANRG